MISIWTVFEGYAGHGDAGRISRPRRRVALLPAGMFIIVGLTGLLAAASSAFAAASDGFVLCQASGGSEVYTAASDACDRDADSHATGLMDFGGDGAMKMGNVQLNTGVNGLSTFGDNVNFNGLIQVHQATINEATIGGSLSVASGASINMGGNRITNVGAPTNGTDATTKAYVDSLVGSGSSLNTTVSTHTTQIAALQTTVSTHTTEIATLNTTVNTHTTQIAALDSTVNVHTTQIAGLDSRVTANTSAITALDGRVGALETGLDRLDGRVDKAFEGAAMAMAMAAPAMPTDKNYAVSINWGDFGGKNAFAGTVQARVSEDFMIHGGIGFGSSGTVGGRAGLTYAW